MRRLAVADEARDVAHGDRRCSISSSAAAAIRRASRSSWKVVRRTARRRAAAAAASSTAAAATASSVSALAVVARDDHAREQIQPVTRRRACRERTPPHPTTAPRTGHAGTCRRRGDRSAGVVQRDALGRGRVGAAEQHRVDEQRQRAATARPALPALRQRRDLRVGGEDALGAARRTAPASPGRPRGARRRPRGRSATDARRRRPSRCRPTGRRAAAPAARPDPPARRAARTRAPPRGRPDPTARRARGRDPPAGAGAARRRRRASRRLARSAG